MVSHSKYPLPLPYLSNLSWLCSSPLTQSHNPSLSCDALPPHPHQITSPVPPNPHQEMVKPCYSLPDHQHPPLHHQLEVPPSDLLHLAETKSKTFASLRSQLHHRSVLDQGHNWKEWAFNMMRSIFIWIWGGKFETSWTQVKCLSKLNLRN